MFISKDILASGTWDFPRFCSVVEIPVLRSDGSVVDTRGYDKQPVCTTGRKSSLVVPPIPTHPSSQQIKQSLALIDEAIGEFPYTDTPSRANAIALLLTPLIRHAITGQVPIALLDAPQQGTGKSLLGKVVSNPCDRAAKPQRRPLRIPMRNGVSESPQRYIPVPQVITIDNIEGTGRRSL